MRLNEYQKKASETAIFPYDSDTIGVLYTILGCVNESCELAEAYGSIITMNMDKSPKNLTPHGLYALNLLNQIRELGELVGNFKKQLRGDDGNNDIADNANEMLHLTEVSDEDIDILVKELGDVQWYISQTTRQLGKTLSCVAKKNISKLQERKKNGVLMGNGDDR